MPGYCILSIKKYHTFPQLAALQKHNDREIPLPNVDQSLSIRNVPLICRGDSYTGAWHEIVEEEEARRGQKVGLRKNSVLAIEVVTGFSSEAGEDINLNAWAEKSLNWVKETFGERNIIASTLHLDETTPHIHTEVVPIDSRGRLNAKGFTNGRMAMIGLHTSYAREMECFGLRRGERASKAKKKELVSFYKAVKQASSAALPPRLNGESEEDYIKRMEAYCRKMKLAAAKLEMDLESANALIGTRIAQEFSRYSHAVSLYEDLYEKFGGDERRTNARLTTYRKIENRVPEDSLPGLFSTILDRFASRATPLTNWAKKGKRALEKPPAQEEECTASDAQELYVPIQEEGQPMAESDGWEYDGGWEYGEDDNTGRVLDI